jgi:hypothetical protein
MNIAGVTGAHLQLCGRLVGWMRGGLGHVNIVGSVIFSGMSGTAIADAAGPWHHRNQGDEGPRLFDGVFRRRDRGIRNPWPDHPAVAAVRDLRHDG